MSRYETTTDFENVEFTVAYGHDHATGYFVQVYHSVQSEPLAGKDDLFGNQSFAETGTPIQYKTLAVKLADLIFTAVHNGDIATARMDRDPKYHLGARIAAQLMPTRGNA